MAENPVPMGYTGGIAELAGRLAGTVGDAPLPARADACPYPVVPNRDRVIEAALALRLSLFPHQLVDPGMDAMGLAVRIGAILTPALATLEEQIGRSLAYACSDHGPACRRCPESAREIVGRFAARLPEVQRILATDIAAAYAGDPAARSASEVVLCYPGLFALALHRLAHELLLLSVPLLPRIISEHAHSVTGIDIHPGATIGPSFFIDHGTGVVIGETAVIGERVRVYQGVTLGAKSFPSDGSGNLVKGIPRHPIVEDDVVLYSGATILGRVTIGKGSVIGGNVWLTRSVPPGATVTQAQAKERGFENGAGI